MGNKITNIDRIKCPNFYYNWCLCVSSSTRQAWKKEDDLTAMYVAKSKKEQLERENSLEYKWQRSQSIQAYEEVKRKTLEDANALYWKNYDPDKQKREWEDIKHRQLLHAIYSLGR